MNRSRASLVALVVLAIFATLLSGCGRKGLIKVNGEKVGREAFYERLARVPVQTQQGTQLAGRYVVQQMISEMLVGQLAKDQGVYPSDKQIDAKMNFIKKQGGADLKKIAQSRGMTIEDLKRQVTLEQCFINVATKGIKVSDDKVKKAYDQALNAPNSPFKRPEQVKISGIINKDKAKVEKAYSLLNGGQEFSAVAVQYTDDNVGKQQGGAIGWVSKDMKVLPDFVRNTAFSLPIGTYSKPTLVQGKWIILKADQKRAAKVTSYDEVKDMIREQLAVAEGNQKGIYRDAITKYTKKAEITVNGAAYQDIPDMIKKQAAKAVAIPGQTGGAKAPTK